MVINVVITMIVAFFSLIVARLMYENNLRTTTLIDKVPRGITSIPAAKWVARILILFILYLIVGIGLNERVASVIMGLFIGVTDEVLKERNH